MVANPMQPDQANELIGAFVYSIQAAQQSVESGEEHGDGDSGLVLYLVVIRRVWIELVGREPTELEIRNLLETVADTDEAAVSQLVQQ